MIGREREIGTKILQLEKWEGMGRKQTKTVYQVYTYILRGTHLEDEKSVRLLLLVPGADESDDVLVVHPLQDVQFHLPRCIPFQPAGEMNKKNTRLHTSEKIIDSHLLTHDRPVEADLSTCVYLPDFLYDLYDMYDLLVARVARRDPQNPHDPSSSPCFLGLICTFNKQILHNQPRTTAAG